MDYPQSILWQDYYPLSGFTIPNNILLTNSYSVNRNFLTDNTNVQVALTLIPSVVLLLLSPIRAIQLRRATLKVLPNYTGAIKFLLTVSIAALELTALILCLTSNPLPNESSILIQVVLFVATLTLCLLSFLEHGRSVKPSTLLIFYLFASIISEGLVLSFKLVNHGSQASPAVLTAAFSLKLALLIVESKSKRSYLRDPYKDLPVEQTSSDINRAFLVWVGDLVLLGNSKLLTYSDLPGLDDRLKSRGLRMQIEEEWEKTVKSRSQNESSGGGALLWTILKLFRGALLLNIIPRFMMIAFRYSQPIFINTTIRYVTNSDIETEGQDATGYCLILAAFAIYMGIGVSFCIYYQTHNRIKVQSRGAIIGLIHARCLTMRDGVYDDAAAVTHMSSDTDHAENLAWLSQEISAQMVEFFIGVSMLWVQLGWWCLTPVVVVVVLSQIARWAGSRIGESMADWQGAKQKRIALTSSMIDYLKSIKMMGMANTIMSRIQESRMTDLTCQLTLIVNGISILAPVVTLIAYAADAHFRGRGPLDPVTAFTAISTVTLVTTPANTILSLVPQFATSYGCLTRIQGYLLEPSRNDRRILIEPKSRVNDSIENQHISEDVSSGQSMTDRSPAVIIEDVVLRPAITADICLDRISAQLEKGSLNIFYGAVGTGKTTLARAILGDVIPDSGSIFVSTKRIGYCAQKPWLINANIRTMVCGLDDETEIDEKWYETVIHACGLDEDIRQLSGGDLGAAGSRGVTLSGGQRQRVALARVVYSRPEIVILDDVLSALDSKTEAHVAEMLIGPDGIFRRLGTTVILITHASQHLPLADMIIVLANSKIKEQGTWDYFQSSTDSFGQVQTKKASSNYARNAISDKPPVETNAVSFPESESTDLSRRYGDISVYVYYFRCVSIPVLALFISCNITDGIALALTPSILRMWSEAGGSHTWLYMIMYGLSSLLAFTATGSVIWSTIVLIAPKAGEVLHYRLLKTIMRAPLSYFAVTDTGAVLNRFTEDISYVDHTLPYNLMNTFWQFSKLVSQLTLLFITQGLVAIAAPFLFLVLYVLQKLYLYTSRQTRFMDIELRAKVLSNFLDTLEGISHVRAFGWQTHTVNQNIRNLDTSQGAHYAMLSIQQWLTLVLDMLVAGLCVLVVGFAVVFRASTTGGQIGIALYIIHTISNTLTRLLQSWTQLETSLGAISRIKTLEETLQPEDKECECSEPPINWPDRGAIEFKEVIASYNPKTISLNGISINITPGQKVGICGRTGSGKSTLLLSILRLVELDSGSIAIDGIDICTLPRETIRAKIIAIPQDTFVLNDSVRLNVDPSGIASDEKIRAALEKVQLWDIMESRAKNMAVSTEAARVADGEIADGEIASTVSTVTKEVDPLEMPLKASPLSHGQFQLFGLARALLLRDRSSVLILDEATSNVDANTDKLMQRIIKEEFTQHTIMTIAHRLDTIRDADIILVMDKGKVVEFGTPNELLAKGGDKTAIGVSAKIVYV
ncbi:P-loop containing nucleoside triphosphate hydrolase protein [Nemania sp. FL0916]|nr:P-loop containing nucleoside triphosphate hydrolase protein [Nemania sp. FL0916]